MSCPKCGGEQYCPCSNCAEGNKGQVLWKWDVTGEIISCGHCGFTAHADDWFEWDMENSQRLRERDDSQASGGGQHE